MTTEQISVKMHNLENSLSWICAKYKVVIIKIIYERPISYYYWPSQLLISEHENNLFWTEQWKFLDKHWLIFYALP